MPGLGVRSAPLPGGSAGARDPGSEAMPFRTSLRGGRLFAEAVSSRREAVSSRREGLPLASRARRALGEGKPIPRKFLPVEEKNPMGTSA